MRWSCRLGFHKFSRWGFPTDKQRRICLRCNLVQERTLRQKETFYG